MHRDTRYKPSEDLPTTKPITPEAVTERKAAAQTTVQYGDRTVPATEGVDDIADGENAKVLGGGIYWHERGDRFNGMSID